MSNEIIDVDRCNWIVQSHREERWIEIELPKKSPPTYVCVGANDLAEMSAALLTGDST